MRDIGVVKGECISTTGPRLVYNGVELVQSQLADLKNTGGTFIVEDADNLANGNYRSIMDFIFTEMKRLIGTVVFIFAGGNNLLENFIEHDPGLQNQLPFSFQLPDFTEGELLQILELSLQKKIFQLYNR